MPRTPGGKRTQRSTNREEYRRVQDVLGEESDSSFQSVSTNINDTDYALDYSGRNLNPARQVSGKRDTRVTVSPHKESPADRRTGLTTSQRRVAETQVGSARRAALRSSSASRREYVGSTRRKSKSPQRSQRQVAGPNFYRPRGHVLKDIRKFQASTKLLIPKLPFSRVIREVLLDYGNERMRVTPTALEALQESAELYLVQLFSDAYKCTFHRDRVTLMVKDIQLVRYLRGRIDPGNL